MMMQVTNDKGTQVSCASPTFVGHILLSHISSMLVC